MGVNGISIDILAKVDERNEIGSPVGSEEVSLGGVNRNRSYTATSNLKVIV